MADDIKFYGKSLQSFSNAEQFVLMRKEEMQQRRTYYESMWQRNDFAFQAFLYNQSAPFKNQFDNTIAPELQFGYNGYGQINQGFKYADLRYPLEFAVITRKMKDELPNFPKPVWTTLGETKIDKATIFRYIFDYETYKMELDRVLYESLLRKNIYGTAPIWIYAENYKCVEQVPKVDKNGKITFKEIEYFRRRIVARNVDLWHFWVDEGANDISEAEDCIIAEFYSPNKFKQVFADCDIWDSQGEVRILPQTKSESYSYSNDQKGHNLTAWYEVLHYYNYVTDKYVVLANGKEIKRSAIPALPGFNGKQLPVSIYYDHKLPNSFYGIGECDLLTSFREIKNKIRNLIFDVTKKQAKPTLIIDPLSVMDTESFEFGMDIIKGNPSDVGQINIQANLEWVWKLDAQTTEDVIQVTGININDIGQSGSAETATKTAIRQESQIGIINLGLLYNSNVFFKRLYLLIKDMIRLYKKAEDYNPLTGEPMPNSVMVKNKRLVRDIDQSGEQTIIEEPSDIATYFDYTAEDLDNDFDCITELGNIALTKELDKARKMETLEKLVQMFPQSLDQTSAPRLIAKSNDLPEDIFFKSATADQIMPPTEETAEQVLSKFKLHSVPERVRARTQFANPEMMQGTAPEEQTEQKIPVAA